VYATVSAALCIRGSIVTQSCMMSGVEDIRTPFV
jgi:hypothetical protein